MHQPLLHYNEQDESNQSQSAHHNAERDADDAQEGKKRKTTCADYLKRFDQLILRPILIHKYEKDSEKRAKEFYEMFAEEGNQMKKLYHDEQRKHNFLGSKVSDKTHGSSKTDFLKSATMVEKRRASVSHHRRQRGSDQGSQQSVSNRESTNRRV